ncbi:Major intrinsic protein [Popillia japonica]|uniref:Major intrinsic protein n=1 Tax=Popillia japonica TaxID=7064 RepID=A0AAW1JWG0_POPJA
MVSTNVTMTDEKVEDKASTISTARNVLILCLGEMLGVALLLFLGCMGCIVEVYPYPVTVFAPFNFGLAVALAIQTVIHISGAHLNPAVSVAAWIMGKLQLYLVPFYIIAQLVGGIIGYGLIIAPFSGGGFNPARSLAPSIYQNIWTSHWVYWVGPLLGGVLAAVVYRYTFLEGLSNVKKNS